MILIKDSEFIRGNCPMTKEEIRALSIWKMDLKENSNVLDIGSGTGTISIQAAMISNKGQVTSIERDEEAFITTNKNIEKFKADNINLIKGDAVDIIDSLLEKDYKFDSIFIGGSGGNLEDIIEKSNTLLRDKDSTLVMNFITLNNAYKGIEKVKNLGLKVDITNINVSKNKGDSYMMIANNPIYIVKCKKGDN